MPEGDSVKLRTLQAAVSGCMLGSANEVVVD